MTITETPRDFEPDPAAPWPPDSCPAWCQESRIHSASDSEDSRFHESMSTFVELSAPQAWSPEPQEWVGIFAEQGAGREPRIALSLWEARIARLTIAEALELSDKLRAVVESVGGSA